MVDLADRLSIRGDHVHMFLDLRRRCHESYSLIDLVKTHRGTKRFIETLTALDRSPRWGASLSRVMAGRQHGRAEARTSAQVTAMPIKCGQRYFWSQPTSGKRRWVS